MEVQFSVCKETRRQSSVKKTLPETAKKTSTKINFLGPETVVREEKGSQTQTFRSGISSGGVGLFHVKEWGPKSSVCPSKPRETKFCGGISWDFCRDIPVVPEKFEKNMCVFNPRPPRPPGGVDQETQRGPEIHGS